MEPAYSKIAEVVPKLVKRLFPHLTRMPIGLDGAFLERSMAYYCEMKGLPYTNNLQNTVEVSSRYGGFDVGKFRRVIEKSQSEQIYAVDLRANSGSLVSMIERKFDELKEANGYRKQLLTVVAFDPNRKAQVNITNETLSDDERINWLPDIEGVGKLFFEINGTFRENYLISGPLLDSNRHYKKLADAMELRQKI